MPYYQHYSFDLWLTLIQSNPGFKAERARIFHRDFNVAGKSMDEVLAAFRQVDLMCNAVNERTGRNIDSDEMHLMVISLINDHRFDLQTVDTIKLYADMEALVMQYMPVVYSAETMDVLAHLKENTAATLSILSNTAFIKGVTLRRVIKELGMQPYFDFQLYSDEKGMSKPNPALFKLMMANVERVNKGKQINPENIIHIGDNPRADIEGANAAGIKSLLVNSNNLTVSKLIS